MAKYTYYIVTRSADHHYPVLMANNGKQALNEPVKRKQRLCDAITNLIGEARHGHLNVLFITEADFKKKFPRFAKNSGPKKLTTARPKKEGTTKKK